MRIFQTCGEPFPDENNCVSVTAALTNSPHLSNNKHIVKRPTDEWFGLLGELSIR